MGSGSRWRIVVTPQAERELKKLGSGDREWLRQALDALVAFPDRGDVRKLRGKASEWRLRVRDFRVRFRPDFKSRVIVVLRVLSRDRAYRE